MTPTAFPTLPPTCPRCGRDAPIVYRGVVPYCTACGALRVPLSGPSVNLAGKPSRVGGTVAGVFGWLVLIVGWSMALGVGLLLSAFHLFAVALVLALPVALVSTIVGGLLVRQGASLNRTGRSIEQATRQQALLALAAHRGSIHAIDAARALGVSVAEADAMLTELAKKDPDHIAVDVEDHGDVAYRYVDARIRVGVGPRVDVDGEAPNGTPGATIEDDLEEGGARARSPRTVPRP